VRIPPLLLLALLVAPLAACSGGDDSPPAAAPTTAAPTPTVPPTTAPTATSAGSPTPTAPATRGPAQDGDVDGDGRADRVTATMTALQVRLTASGRTVTAPVEDTDIDPVVQGVVDLDRDGFGDVFLETARGASTGFVQVYRYDGSRLRELTLDGGHVRFGFGGSATHGDGFTCTGQGRLVARQAESDDGTTFRVRTRTYRVAGAAFVLESETAVTAKGMDDPRVRAAYEVSCGPVGEGG
jgi:hypothetical protein